MSPLVSVIVPVYNQEKYIEETIESILAQTFVDFELIIIDDGSTDKSADIIKSYAKGSKNILYLFQQNAGKPKAIGYAVSKAQGTLLAFIDHDDLMFPDRLKRQVAFHLLNPEIKASSCHCNYIDHNGATIGVQRFTNLKTVEECKNIMRSKELVICAMTGFMIEKKVFIEIGGLKSQYWPCDDYEFFNRLLDEGYVLVIIQEILMKYRIHATATTVSKPLHVDYMKSYVTDCFTRRRSGAPELTFEQFMVLKRNEPLWTKIKERKFQYGFVFLHKASFALYTRKYLGFTWRFIIAFVLSPKYVLAVISNKMKQ